MDSKGSRDQGKSKSKSRKAHSGIVDPALQLLANEQESIVDFIFRLTGDRSRASVMGRETTLQLESELRSRMDLEDLRAACYQRAYELSEEALRPLDRRFLEDYFRVEHDNVSSLARLYRWELYLLELGHHAAILLLLQFRYGFDLHNCSLILGRDQLESESEILQALVKKKRGMDLADLKDLPRYGFVTEKLVPQTALSRVMVRMRVPHARPLVWIVIGVLLASTLLGFLIGRSMR